MIMRYGEKGKCWSTYLDCCLQNKTITFDESLELSRTKQKKILFKLREIIKERKSRDFTNDPMSPSTNNDVFSTADEFPPLQPSAAPQAPPTYQAPPPSQPVTRSQTRPQPASRQQPLAAIVVQQSPNTSQPPQHVPQEIQLRPQQVRPQQMKQIQLRPQQISTQQTKQAPRSAQPKQTPTSPRQVQSRSILGQPGMQQSRMPVHPPQATGSQQRQSPSSPRQAVMQPTLPQTLRNQSRTQQSVHPRPQQARQSNLQQSRQPGGQQTHTHGFQLRPQVAAGVNSRLPRQAEPYSMLTGRQTAAKPSKLHWGEREQGLAPGAIESPAEFPPLGAAPVGKKQRPGPQPKPRGRQIPSNSIRELSSRQMRKNDEKKSPKYDLTSSEGTLCIV